MSGTRQRTYRMKTFLLGACAAFALVPAAAHAQPGDRIRYNIVSSDLGTALTELARQSSREIYFPADLTRGLRAPRLRGPLSVEQALDRLLRGSGLVYRLNAGGAIVIERSSSGEAPAGSAAADSEEPEIIVTAQGRAQRLQEVALSVTAVGGDEIEARGAANLEDLQYSVPGLSLTRAAPGQDLIQIRGISTALGEATIGIYVDEFPLTGDKVQAGGFGASPDFRTLDLERIEVLRGPQGTRYGSGSMGGTIRYVTASPDLDEVSGFFEAEAASVTDGSESYNLNGVLNLPLVTDRLGVRLVAGYQREGGWIDNSLTGEEDINDAEFLTLRARVLARPTDGLELSVLYLHQELDQDNQNLGIDRVISSTVQTFNRDRYDLINGIIRYDFGSVTVLNSVGYLDRRTRWQADFTQTFLPFLEAPPPIGFGLPPGFITAIPFFQPITQRVFTEELRFASDGGGRFNWTIGGYYRHGFSFFDDVSPTSPGTLPFLLFGIKQRRSSDFFAVFGEADYQLTDRLNILIGGRYSSDKQRSDSTTTVFGAPSGVAGEETFSTFNPRFAARYEFSPDSMAYVNVAKGFRSGGFNVGAIVPGIPDIYEPDSVWSYEVGTRHQLFDRRLTIDAAVYYTDWSNAQSLLVRPGTNVATILNGGTLSGWGIDLAIVARPTEGLTLSGTYAWNNIDHETSNADHIAGDPVDYARQETYSASLDYRQPIFGSAVGFFRADYQHASEAQVALRNALPAPSILPSYDLVNLRAGLEIGRFEVSMFVTNLADEDAPLIPASGGNLFNDVEQRPRTIGVNFKARM